MRGPILSRRISLVAAFMFSNALSLSAHAQVQFDLPIQPLAQALRSVGNLADLNVYFDPDLVEGLQAPALKAQLSADEALARLLAGTQLHAVHVDENTVRVVAEPAARRAQGNSATDTGVLYPSRSAHLASASANPDPVTGADEPQAPLHELERDNRSDRKKDLEEIVVTGTQIHGAQPASQVLIFDRSTIERQGFGSVKDFIQSLPQNFNGGASENTISSVTGQGNANNQVNATGINLRGLGNDATLVLLNGERLAPGNIAGNFIDVSLIPLSAVERIEVLPDGASAIYGSDAVGGVVNFILRKDLEGAETRLRFGSVTQGSREDYQASQAFGHNWESGSALLVYDFDKATPLEASDRAYTAQTTVGPYTLLPRQQRHSVVLSGQQDLAPGLQFFGDGTFSHRAGESDVTLTNVLTQAVTEEIDAYSATAGVRGSVFDNLRFELSSNYGKSGTRSKSATMYFGSSLAPRTDGSADADIVSLEAKVDGTLLKIPTGQVLFALGGQYRREAFSFLNHVAVSSTFSDDRNVRAAFAELQIPLIPSSGDHASALQLEAADRYERYSDFGSTNNPKVGLIWRASPELDVRASWGTSFVAPLLSDLNPLPSQVAALPSSNLTPGAPDTLFIFGGNPELRAQQSSQWTLGMDFSQAGSSAVTAHIAYYNISFEDRIANAQGFINLLQAFQFESLLGPLIVQRNPAPSYLQMLEAQPTFVNFGVPNLATITAVVDSREQNLSSVKTSGLDFSLSRKFSLGAIESEVGIDGTYILQYDNQFTRYSPSRSFLNLAYNPTDLKLRAHGSMQWGPATFGAFFNYVNAYRNEVNGVFVPVASWETIDLTAAYQLDRVGALFKGVSVMLGVTNLTDKAPPYVANATPVYGVNYDGANANALGRFLYAQLRKSW